MATETVTQIQREAPEIEKIRMQLLEAAKAQSEAPMTLPGYQVAGLSPEQVDAMQRGVQGIGAYMPYMQQGTNALSAAMGTVGQAAGQYIGPTSSQMPSAFAALGDQAPQGMAGGIGSLPPALGNIDPATGQAVMNPYQQQVIDASLRQIQRQGDIARQNLQAQAVKSGAFGGSREGIQRAELERNMNQQRNDAIINALQQGYESTQKRSLEAAGMLGNLGVQQAAMGQNVQQMGQSDVDFLYNIGAQQQRQSQAELDATRATAMQAAMQPVQNIAFLSDIYRGAPSTQMSMTQSSVPSPSPFQQIAGLGTGLLATAGAARQAGLFGDSGSKPSSI